MKCIFTGSFWRDSPDEEISEYAITRVNIGDRPAGCIAQLAMRETAHLPNFLYLDEERRVIEEDSYVDDLLTSQNDRDKLDKVTANVEEILKAGGFFLKPWVRAKWEAKNGDRGSNSDTRENLNSSKSKEG